MELLNSPHELIKSRTGRSIADGETRLIEARFVYNRDVAVSETSAHHREANANERHKRDYLSFARELRFVFEYGVCAERFGLEIWCCGRGVCFVGLAR